MIQTWVTAVEEIDAEYKGKPISIGFNARYLLDG
jgi:DNA polymerase III sliding clamp (beta) subunit (PCNA family)